MNYVYPSEKIFQYAVALLKAVGVSEEEAIKVATVLLDTTLEGIDTHGISRLPIYIKCLKNGRINPNPNINLVRLGAIATVDGDNGLGQLIAERAMAEAIELAQNFGIGLAVVKRSNHFGASSYYCKMAAKKGLIGIVFTNTPSAMPPWGGKRAYLGTNPIAFGFPYEEYPVIVDLSTSCVARGHIIQAAKEGREIPLGWAADKYGNPTTDPKAALEGFLLPMGGVKGYALALAVEVMSGILSGSAFGDQVGFIYDENTTPANIGHSFIAINVANIMPLNIFLDRMRELITKIKAVPLADGAEEIRIPGEKRFLTYQKRLAKGIPINETLLKELKETAKLLGVKPLEGGYNDE